MLKDLFLPITGASTDDAALSVADSLAAAYGARLIVSVPAAVPNVVAAPWGFAPSGVLADLLDEVENEAVRRAESLRSRLANSAASVDVRVDRTRIFDPPDALVLQARYADLAVLARPVGTDAETAHAFFNAFLFGSGRPILAIPADKAPRSSGRYRKLLLAWKPTREATRAVHDAIALLEPTEVEVLVVDPDVGLEGHGEEPGADIAGHLAQHGLRVNVSRRPSGMMSVATTILLHAAESGADLVVAGGYGHAKLREWVLGGATRQLLEGMETPVLFSH